MTYINPRTKVFSHLGRVVAWQRGEKPAPVTIEWDLSNVCSLGCTSCHFAYTHTKGPWAAMSRAFPVNQSKGGSLADPVLVSRVLEEVAHAGVRAIVWTGGGEPTLHPSWVSIVERAHACGLEQGMYTHGGHLTVETGRALASHATWVVVSLDCIDEASYAREKKVHRSRFRAACDGIVHLVGYRAVVGVSFLLHATNWMYAKQMVALARELGATYTTLRPEIHASPADPQVVLYKRDWITHALPILDELALEPDVEVDPARFVEYRDWRSHGYDVCQGIRLNTTITPDGRVWVCPNRREYADSCLGDLKTESFADIWARHPGQWTDFRECRAMCRLHPVNQQLAAIEQERPHEAFI